MSADPHTIREWLYDSLSDLEDNLGAAGDDGRLLESLRMRIAAALSEHAGAEQEIRTVLQERYDDGHLRTETYEQVCGLLDRQVTEDLDTEPTGQLQPAGRHPVSELDLVTAQLDAAPAVEEDHYSTTTILHHEVQRLATADDQVQAGSVLRDRFLLQERVSGGSMGVVYKALDRRMAEAGASEPWVAIKVLSPQLAKNGTALRALQQEAAKGRCLSHANIVRFIDLDREDDLYFIVMEWLEGQTLAAILDSTEGKTMGTDQAMRIVRQLANALGYAHRCGIVHADVKPANVMIQPNGDVKLFDFGVARVRQSQKENQEDFDPGVLGALTPAYSSMQVLTGEDPAPADDVFSLGCLFYRLVAGYRVFGPRNAAEAAAEGMAPQRPQGLTEGQWRALKKAISYSRVTRFQSMNEFMAALEERV
ncbi:MAG TPA: serine/threonine-protein kinase, partial [Woeseiaceae bacterium]|nr:serine/threonine-protein kinase [Woeseiaceae bacterium]